MDKIDEMTENGEEEEGEEEAEEEEEHLISVFT